MMLSYNAGAQSEVIFSGTTYAQEVLQKGEALDPIGMNDTWFWPTEEQINV